MYVDLATVFEEIKPPTNIAGEGAHFSALPVTGLERHRIAKDVHGSPAVLISVADASGASRPASIVLKNLTVEHNIECRILRPDDREEVGRFTVVRCTGEDPALRHYFLRVAATMIQSLGIAPSSLSVSHAVSRLAELFHAMTGPPRKSLQGLWAELFLIARAFDPITMASAWHIAPEDIYDFSLGNQRIEVKSTRGRVRRHYFSLEQLQPPTSVRLLVASMFVEACETGTSLSSLIEQIRSRLSNRPDLIFRVESVVGLTLGEGWRQAIKERFDCDLAEESLAFYDPLSIPKVSPDTPSGVSEVRFRSDLTGLQAIETATLKAAKGLLRAALRR